jgi:hypothetical protein
MGLGLKPHRGIDHLSRQRFADIPHFRSWIKQLYLIKPKAPLESLHHWIHMRLPTNRVLSPDVGYRMISRFLALPSTASKLHFPKCVSNRIADTMNRKMSSGVVAADQQDAPLTMFIVVRKDLIKAPHYCACIFF